MRKLIPIFVLLLSLNSKAHDDHGPGNVPLQKGGVMRVMETVNLELVYKDGVVQIYPFETQADPKNPGKLKSADPKKFPVSASVQLPKGKTQAADLKILEDRWEFAVDAKGIHRFTVLFAIKQGGHDDKIKWTVEPKK